MDIKTTILLFALVCALAAFFVMWAKYEEEKLKTKAERENYQAALNLHNMAAEMAQYWQDANDDKIGEILFYHSEYKKLETEANKMAYELCDTKQDLKSALHCPRNDHVWKDGRCVKCGRVK